MNPFPIASRNARGGFALVLVLGFVVLLTVIILAFFSNSLLQRQVAYSSANQAKADLFTQGALDSIVGDLKQEIVDGSTASTITTGTVTSTIYYPTSPATIVPYRAGTDNSWPNLVKRSANGVSFYPTGSGYAQAGPSRAANCNTTASSVNGRYYSASRWNQALLLPPNSTTDFTPNTSTAFTPPDWILVAQDGSNPTAWNVNLRSSPLQTTTVLGRYAYCIYDEGGLLDINAAGYLSTPSDAEIPNKIGEPYADLTQLMDSSGNSYLTQAQVNQIVNWRNAASLQQTPLTGYTAYASYVLTNLTGFLTTANLALTTTAPTGQSDQRFISRQQMISFFANVLGGTLALDNSLQYLTTFSRDVNAPSWVPTTPTGSTVDYGAQKNATTSANRAVLGVRVSKVFGPAPLPLTRGDGTTPQIGDLLLTHRFPLSRLAGLTYQGINTTAKTTMLNGVLTAATAATIQRDFGLVWVTGTHSGALLDIQNADHWNYVGPTGTTIQYSIATLAQVAAAGREPNFFELLKAAVLSGSLGRDAGANGVFYADLQAGGLGYEQGPASGVQTYDTNVDFQVIQMGANIIDQSDADSYPTEIHFYDASSSETRFYGVENLPYIQRVFEKTLYPITNPTNSAQTQCIGGWLTIELWNPHQNWGMTAATTPTKFRYCGSGISETWVMPNTGYPYYTPYQRQGTTPKLQDSGSIDFTVDPFANPTLCRLPTLLGNDVVNTPSLTPDTITSGMNGTNNPFGTGMMSPVPPYLVSGTVAGLYSGCVDAHDTGGWGGMAPQGCYLALEYLAPTGNYQVFQVMKNLTAKEQSNTQTMCYYLTHVDPRTDRFGSTLGQWAYNSSLSARGTHGPGVPLRSDSGQGYNCTEYFPVSTSGFHYASGDTPAAASSIYNNFFMGTLTDNSPTASPTASNPWYNDPDGIIRPGDGAYAATDTSPNFYGRPLAVSDPSASPVIFPPTTSGPIILNRPFRTVGELGYAFRDDPFKSLDMMTPNSGDAALLDFFCVNETAATPSSTMVAGAVNLNTRQPPVLQAIIAGALKDALNPTTTGVTGGNSSDAQTVANSIVAWTTAASPKGPFTNRNDLVTKAGSILTGGSAANDSQIKLRREAALRALSNVGTARTWTLLIDVIAQVGRYPANATGLSQFVAEGEKRYWLHISIDRYTGQVIDRSLEPVYE